MSETDLIIAWKGGSQEAGVELWNRHKDAIKTFARRYVEDPILLDDVLQDTFILANRGIGRFEARSGIRTWLCRIGINVALQHRRRNLARKECRLSDVLADSQEDHRTEQDRNRRELDEAIAVLPPEQAQVVCMRRLGHTYQDMATTLGVSVSTVSSRLHAAYLLLRRLLH